MMRTGDERSQLLRDRLTFAHRRIDEVEEVRIAVDGEPIRSVSLTVTAKSHRASLYVQVRGLRSVNDTSAADCEEMAEVVFSRPSNGITPAVFCRLGDDSVVHLKWQVALRRERLQCL